MKKITPQELPNQIKVRIKRAKGEAFLAELPDYNVFTEADNPVQVFLNINDLIYTLFDVPQKLQGKIFYAPQPRQISKRKSINSSYHPYLMVKVIEERRGNYIPCS